MIRRSLLGLLILSLLSSVSFADGNKFKSKFRDLPRVTWEERKLKADVLVGTSTSLQSSFVFQNAPQLDENSDLNIWVSPGLRRFVSGSLRKPAVADESTSQIVDFSASFPLEAKTRPYFGVALLRDGRRPIARPLFLRITAQEPSSTAIPDRPASPTGDRIVIDNASGSEYVKGEVIIGLSDGSTESDLSVLVGGFGGGFVGSVQRLGYYQVSFPDAETEFDLDLLINQLQESPVVEFANRSWIYEAQTTTPLDGRDPEYEESGWNQILLDGRRNPLVYSTFLEAWDFGTGNKNVPIAVIDTGFDCGHEDLAANFTCVSELSNVNKPRNHGTAVAGIIGAEGNNAFGITGAMWTSDIVGYSKGFPKIPFLIDDTSLRMLGLDIADALVDAIQDGAKIINMSAGVDTNGVSDPSTEIINALKLGRDNDVLFVFAAGNQQNGDISSVFPARLSSDSRFDNIISVAQIGVAAGSVFNPSPVAAGNGGNVTVAAPGCFWLVRPDDLYGVGGRACGSSYSAPLVTGLAGLLLSYDDDLSASDVKQLIIDGAVDKGNGIQVNGESFYVINARRSLELLVSPPPPPPPPPPTSSEVFLVGSASGVVRSLNQRLGAAVPTGVSIGDAVSVSFSYSLTNAQIVTSQPNFRSFFFPGSIFSGLEVTIGNLTWTSSQNTSVPNNAFGFVALLTDYPIDASGPGVWDLFTLGGKGDQAEGWPGAISAASTNNMNLNLQDFTNVLLKSLDLPEQESDLDLSGIGPDRAAGSLTSTDGRGFDDPSWSIVYELDVSTLSIEIQEREPDMEPTAVGQWLSFIEGDPGVPDGVDVVNPSGINSTNVPYYILQNPIALSGLSSGFTYTTFSSKELFPGTAAGVMIGTLSNSGTCSIPAGFATSEISTPVVNGVTGGSSFVSESFLTAKIAAQCPGVALSDLYIVGIYGSVTGSDGGLDFSGYTIDAAIVNLGIGLTLPQ